MIILSIRTDKPEAELGLFEDSRQLAYEVWTAHRQLAETIHIKIRQLLDANHRNLADIEGVVCYKGPGSFTGLRIGLSVANALAYSLNVPVVGVEGEEGWLERALKDIIAGKDESIAIPAYGAAVHITTQKG